MRQMKSGVLLSIAAGLSLFACQVQAHDVPNMEHSHAFEQTGYGQYRQGHYVNGPQGSIIIWSAKPKYSTNGADNVRFARPEPITKAPTQPFSRPDVKIKKSGNYGTESIKDYGQ
jgi:hypothetical protein